MTEVPITVNICEIPGRFDQVNRFSWWNWLLVKTGIKVQTLSKMKQTQNDASKPKSRETGKWFDVHVLVENKKKLLHLWLALYFT